MHPRPSLARRTLAPLLGAFCSATLCAAVAAAAPRAAEQTAFSLPRPATAGGGDPALPRLVAAGDAARLRRIFEAQARGDLAAAQREEQRLEDRRLLGHVLADRWGRTGGAPTAAEVQQWLASYADHPDAGAIFALLLRLSPRGAALPPPPAGEEALAPDASLAPEERERGPAEGVGAALERTVRERARDGNLRGVTAAIAGTRGLGGAQAARLRAEAGLILFQSGRDEDALRLATEALRTAPPGSAAEGRAAFAAGLAAWGLERWDTALPLFERAARADGAAPASRAAAAFWTARAAVRARRPAAYVPWMLQAAQEPRTFYGLVARRALGLPNHFAWERELAGEAEGGAVAETAGGWRALALIQIGQTARAEAELRQLWSRARGNPGLARGMLLAAQAAGLDRLATQLAAASQEQDGRPRDYARFPVPALMPAGGYRVDPALLYALALQESRFLPGAVSPAGARGLLQIMPATASYVAGDPGLRGAGVRRLHEPAFSLEIGQRYVHYLARHEAVDGDLIRLLAAYNAGPGNLSRWLPTARHRDDPFLFIEAIPIDETRGFVQRVLAYSWIYASRLGLPAPSLDRLAGGGFPTFAGVDEVAGMLQERRRRLH